MTELSVIFLSNALFCLKHKIDKIGTVKEEAFFTLLKLHNVALTEDEIKRLKRDYGRSGKINYTEALHSINIDLDVAILNE